MSASPLLKGFDGLISLSRHEGVDVRPTLLRVLTDLYVQSPQHSDVEERQYIELASRLIEQVDDATRAAVRARLAIYPNTPAALREKLQMAAQQAEHAVSTTPEAPATANNLTQLARRIPEAPRRPSSAMPSYDAQKISDAFFRANAGERAQMLGEFSDASLKAAAPIASWRANLAIETLEMAAYAADRESFALELGQTLLLPARTAAQIVVDPSGEALACAAKAIGVPSVTFQRILMFLNAERGSSVTYVYRLSRLYDRLSERAALVMIAAWRGASGATTRPGYRPALYDNERNRPRAAGLDYSTQRVTPAGNWTRTSQNRG